MKNFLKIGLVATILFTSLATYANDENLSLKVKSNDQKSITFLVKEAQDVDFSIYDSENELLYTQKIHTSAPVAKTYNLEAFPDGAYLVKLETDSQITEYQIKIENGKTTILTPVVTERMKPVLTKEKELITLNLENLSQGPVEVKILNERNDQLYSKIFNAKPKFTKTFNVGQSFAKELTFIVKSKNQEFIQTLAIN